jgi:hypothetical protein
MVRVIEIYRRTIGIPYGLGTLLTIEWKPKAFAAPRILIFGLMFISLLFLGAAFLAMS